MCIFFFLWQKWRLKFFKIWLTKCLINVIQVVIFLLWYSYSTALVCVSIDIHTESVDSTKKLGFYLKWRHCQHGQTIHIWSQDIVFTHFEILLTSAKILIYIFNIISNSKILYQMLIILDIPKINSQRHVHCINKLGWILL